MASQPKGLQALGDDLSSFVSVTVPEGTVPGTMVSFAGPDGKQHSAMVPAGHEGSQSFKVQFLHGIVFQSQLVQVPEGVSPGTSIAFVGPCGQPRMAVVPEGVKPHEAFPVQVPVPQPVPVLAHSGATPGDVIVFCAPDGKPRQTVVPEGIDPSAGQTFIALIDPMPVAPVEPLESEELQPWLNAAREFKMNADFEVPSATELDPLDFGGLMNAMKKESAGKLTIQALSDKIILSRMLDNMNMPQMPLLLAVQDAARISEEVGRFVAGCTDSDSQDFIAKPTHLSNAEGVTTVTAVSLHADEKPKTVEVLETHLQTFMKSKAKEFESEALQSLAPGFIIQPKYVSSIGFHIPLELRIVTLWGKARMGIWWWGAPYSGSPNQRNTWLVRRPVKDGELSDDDQWEVAHEHPGNNTGFAKALELFLKHMPQMALAAEKLATAVGAPFLRTDFFVGDPKWGIRLNEVAYGSGTLHRRPSRNGGALLVDDSTAFAQILREGMALCPTKLPAQNFLAQLGARGSTYEDMIVTKVQNQTSSLILGLERHLARESECEVETEEQSVPAELCLTPRCQMPPGFMPGAHEGAGSGNPTTEQANPESSKAPQCQVPRASSFRGVTKEESMKKPESESWASMLDNIVSVAPSWFGLQKKARQKSVSSPKKSSRREQCQPQDQQKTLYVGAAQQKSSSRHIRQRSWRGDENVSSNLAHI